ncbi:MAG: hypothetical protein DCC68_02295 [Planctomycetota bacterium]|nr:MAG: hypothetical protein DCC68_02295 [Planctomycetota bacterium]
MDVRRHVAPLDWTPFAMLHHTIYHTTGVFLGTYGHGRDVSGVDNGRASGKKRRDGRIRRFQPHWRCTR